MAFDFLPNLPKSDLDDREYEDLLKECILRIPRYCPEWTNYNPSDPGITLIELFAWLTDQMLSRFNQVPRRNYVAFLELLGIRLQPPKPAQTEVTFYLVADLPEAYTIATGTEVATVRTESKEAIIFSTDRPLEIGNPQIRHFLTAETADDIPQVLRDRFTGFWTSTTDGEWAGPELFLFNEQPQPGNCFYIVLEPDTPIEGNVVALTFKGQEATPTGINPNTPPRRWEAWNGTRWESVLFQEVDDETQGFSFSDISQRGGNPVQGADILLHLPVNFPVTHFTVYQGRWLRCVFTTPLLHQPAYNNSPRLIGMGAKAIGGTVSASHSELIVDELLGESDGTPGQRFQLLGMPVLDRREDEYLIVMPPGELPQTWQEVTDFSSSGPEDRHYVIDSITGVLQFGPLVLEPYQLQEETELRARIQTSDTTQAILATPSLEQQYSSVPPQQYGAVPRRGSMLRMSRYRIGGGSFGNVQAETITVLKSAIPYVASVTNYLPARNGTDAESLEHAAIKVPQLLRTRDRAVTPEDFELLAIRGGSGAVARAHYLPTTAGQAGTVQLLIVPQANTDTIELGTGIHPDEFTLNHQLEERILDYLSDRKLLGVQVLCREPEYVGVTVQTEVALKPEYSNPTAKQEILSQLVVTLYRFFNPITGGSEGKGWPLGQPAYSSDVAALLQQVPGIRYLGAIQLLELRREGQHWTRLPPAAVINPGPLGVVCSWADSELRSSHVINILQ